jgi:hypothetical protein
MDGFDNRLSMTWQGVAGAAALAAAFAAGATTIPPGTSQLFRDPSNGAIVIPGMNAASDASLLGEMLAEANRPFTITVTTEFASGDPSSVTVISGTVHDWIVKRADTGTLDFYASIHMNVPFELAGVLTRPWELAGQPAVEAGFRDDLVADGNAPTRLGLDGSGKRVSIQYYATDDGFSNYVTYLADSAPVLFRSTLTQYAVSPGRLDYLYASDPWVSTGSTVLDFFVPSAVPEPSMAWLLAAGLCCVMGMARRPAKDGALHLDS